jgi:hypothetical protein
MTLFSSSGHEAVMRSLTEGLSWATDGTGEYSVPSQVAIATSRARLGPEPLAELFLRAYVPLATPATRGASYRKRCLVASDGTTIDVADTDAYAAELCRPGTGRGDRSAFPRLRIVAIGEAGTLAVIAAVTGSCAASEVTLAKGVLASLTFEMLRLADRGFPAHPLFKGAAKTGAQLLWRARSNAVLPVLERHGDGSFHSELVASDDNHKRERVRSVRVIEYPVTNPGRPQAAAATDRLVTPILDPEATPGAPLAALNAERWTTESILDDLKTHQRGQRATLRSRTPSGVSQEDSGHLCVQDAIRAIEHATVEILRDLPAKRRPRSNARVVYRRMSSFNVKWAADRDWPRPTVSTRQAIVVSAPP